MRYHHQPYFTANRNAYTANTIPLPSNLPAPSQHRSSAQLESPCLVGHICRDLSQCCVCVWVCESYRYGVHTFHALKKECIYHISRHIVAYNGIMIRKHICRHTSNTHEIDLSIYLSIYLFYSILSSIYPYVYIHTYIYRCIHI